MLRATWFGPVALAGLVVASIPPSAFPAAPTAAKSESAAERGRKALLTKAYIPPTWPVQAYEDAWKFWGVKEKPAASDYDRLFRDRYGLHPAPYPNGGLPMGLRAAEMVLTG